MLTIPENCRKIVMGVLCVIILIAILQPILSGERLHGGMQFNAHLGGLRGGFDIEAFENDNSPMFVMFYSPRCGWCEQMMPEMDALIAQYKNDGLVKTVKIDCLAEPEMANKHNVAGFPTLRYYPAGLSGTFEEYSSDRTASAMSQFIESKKH